MWRPHDPAEPGRHPLDQLGRELSLADATMLVISSVIGVGIFLTPGTVAAHVPQPGMFLAAWLVGGLLSLAGALANAELGAMYPHAGGDYVYLREAYHPFAGFVAGWFTFFVIYTGTVATLATGFAEGLAGIVPLGSAGKILVASALTLVTSAVNYAGVRAGALFNNLTGAIKLAALAALMIAGPLIGHGDIHRLQPLAHDTGATTLYDFGLALPPVLFTYLGWNASVYVASEIRDPGRTVPRSLFLGLAVCTVIYLGLNAAYLYALPMAQLRGELRVGEAAARALFGSAGGQIMAVLVLASILGCLNANILIGPRVAYAMALDGRFFAGVQRIHDAYRTPHVAILAQALTSTLLIVVLRSFPSILDYTTFAILLATVADTTALYALRRRQPTRHRPYRAWGYPLVPGLYLLANAIIAAAMLWGRPKECVIALAMAATAVPFYFLFSRRQAVGLEHP